ncbi:hypothetical protein HDV01_001523 [Terramyces sp. JEL0728]|nr:hypothetical protein HDV01_001523 [Terramyces sp. JEL0728]
MGKRKNKDKKKEKQQSGSNEKLPVLSTLATGEIEDRTWAATAISNIVQDEENAKQLMAAGVINALLAAIKESSNRLVLESVGALRNVLSVVGETACQECIEKQGLLSILSLMPKLVTELENLSLCQPPDPKKPDNYYDCFMMAEHILSCLWSLAECSDNAVDYLTTATMVGFLFNLWSVEDCPPALQRIIGKCGLMVAQYMNTISEENSKLQKIFASNSEYVSKLFNLLQNHQSVEIRLLAGSILHNIKQEMDGLYEYILSTIVQVLDYDIQSKISYMDTAGKEVDLAMAKLPMNAQVQQIGDMDLVKPENKNTEFMSNIVGELRIIQLALEILTNIYSEEIQEVDDMEADEDHMEVVEQNENSSYLGNVLDEKRLVNRIVSFTLTRIPDLKHDSCKEFNSEVNQIYSKHFSCLNNIFLNAFGNSWIRNNAADAKALWSTYIRLAIELSVLEEPPLEYIDNLVTCVWSVARAFKACDIELSLDDSQAKWLVNAADIDSSAPESLKLKLVGILGLIAQNKNQIPANKFIGEWIMGQIKKANNVEILVELLNAVFDIYGDNFDYNYPVYVKLSFNSILKSALPNIRVQVKSVDKRSNFSLRAHGDECLLNLTNFIKYKDDEAKSLSK